MLTPEVIEVLAVDKEKGRKKGKGGHRLITASKLIEVIILW